MSHPYQLLPKPLSESLYVKSAPGSDYNPEIDINWVLYSPNNPFDCVLVTSMKKHQIALPFGHLRPFFKILLRREAHRVLEPERIRFWKPKGNLSIFQVSQGWTAKHPNLNDVATELPLPAKFRLVVPEKSAVDDGLGNVHLIVTVNPKLNIIEEGGTEDVKAAAPSESFANPMYKRVFPFTSYLIIIEMMYVTEPPNSFVDETQLEAAEPQSSAQDWALIPRIIDDRGAADQNVPVGTTAQSTADVSMYSTTSTNTENGSAGTVTAAVGNAKNVPASKKGEKKETNRLRNEQDVLRAARHTLRTSPPPGTETILSDKVPPHNKEAMDRERVRLVKEINSSENQVFFLGPNETFPSLTGSPPGCKFCQEPVKGLPETGVLGFERVCFCGFRALRKVPGESTYDADERNEKTVSIERFVDIGLTSSTRQLKDRVVKRSIYYHWSCFKDTQKKHYVENPPIRHLSVDPQNWDKVLNDIKASAGASSRKTRRSK
ncbi:hypothetical protein DFS33DRAFT_1482052 [Desarmillaria ectypa]|nr:hypothetical protein DFS33DRAFT_1482052 [Desarmillaria ectypa]